MLTAISDTIRPMAATAPMPGLHGREAETRVFSRALDRAAAGRAGELESARPFGVIAEALECARPSADPRRPAIAALLSTRGGDGSPITVSSDRACSSGRSTPSRT